MSPARNAVFFDTHAMLAMINHRDQWHDAAMEAMRGLRLESTPCVTSDWVFAEFLAACSSSALRRRAAEWTRAMLATDGVDVIAARRTGFLTALDLYESRPDKHWSLVDCSSILICRGRRIKRVFTHDRHFQQAGFQILL